MQSGSLFLKRVGSQSQLSAVRTVTYTNADRSLPVIVLTVRDNM
jgi:hypothetical protein